MWNLWNTLRTFLSRGRPSTAAWHRDQLSQLAGASSEPAKRPRPALIEHKQRRYLLTRDGMGYQTEDGDDVLPLRLVLWYTHSEAERVHVLRQYPQLREDLPEVFNSHTTKSSMADHSFDHSPQREPDTNVPSSPSHAHGFDNSHSDTSPSDSFTDSSSDSGD